MCVCKTLLYPQVVSLAWGVVQSGWTMCSVQGRRRGCGSVLTRVGECTTAITQRTQVFDVLVSVSVTVFKNIRVIYY